MKGDDSEGDDFYVRLYVDNALTCEPYFEKLTELCEQQKENLIV